MMISGFKGIVHDIVPTALAPEIFTDGRNVVFWQGKVWALSSEVLQAMLSEEVIFLLPVRGVAEVLLIGTPTKMYLWDGTSTPVDVSPLTPLSTTSNWSGGLLGTIPVVTNGVDVPFYLDISTQRLTPLPNWPVNYICGTLGVFNRFVLAAGLTIDGVSAPRVLKWSSIADVGNVPQSWDYTDKTVEAGEVELADLASGEILSFLQLNEYNVVYCRNAVWLQQLTDNVFVFTQNVVLQDVQLLSAKAVVPVFMGKAHFFASLTDAYVYDGRSAPESVLAGNRKWIFDQLNYDAVDTSFAVNMLGRKEVWLCVPIGNSPAPNMAVIWNYQDNTTSFTDIPVSKTGAWGLQTLTDRSTFDEVDGVFDTDIGPFDPSESQQGRLILGSGSGIYEIGQLSKGSNTNSYVEREGLVGNLQRKSRVIRGFVYGDGGLVKVEVGGKNLPTQALSYPYSTTFELSARTQFDPYISYGQSSIRFSLLNNSGGIGAYDLELLDGGTRQG